MDILQHLGPSLNVAYCYGAFEEQKCVGIVMELLTGGELFSRIRTGHYSEKGESVGLWIHAAWRCWLPSGIVPAVPPQHKMQYNIT